MATIITRDGTELHAKNGIALHWLARAALSLVRLMRSGASHETVILRP